MATNINFTNDLNDESDANISYNLPRKIYRDSLKRAVAAGATAEAESCTYNIMLDMDYERLLNRASLLVTPTLYKQGVLYPQIPTYNSNGDFSVTRATTATRVNAAGLVELVPYNLFTYSENFLAWTRASISITANTTTAPNGTLTADTLSVGVDASSSRHRLFSSSYSSNTVNAVYTGSFYLKANQNQWIQVIGNIGFSTGVWANFDLVNGVIGNTGGVDTTATITNVGDGWYRCTVSGVATATSTTGFEILTTNNTNSGRYPSYQSLVAQDVCYLWGAQLVQGTSALDYQATETRLNIPRLDYSLGSCPNILLEPQRTNLATYSEQFDNASWTKNFGGIGSVPVVTPNAGISPSGITNADRIQFTLNGGTAVADVSDIRKLITTTSGTYTFSFWVKSFDGVSSYQMLVRDPNGITNQMVVTGEWQRYTITAATYPTGNASVGFGIRAGQTPVNSNTADILVWGAQLEAGAYATSYIPTTSASVTRNADVISRGNIFTNGLITASGGTWFVDLRNNRVLTRDVAANSLFLGDTTTAFTNSFIFRIFGATNHRLGITKRLSGSETLLYTTLTDNVKAAIKWNGTTADIFINGVKVVSETAFTATALEFLNGSAQDVPKYINSMALFPTPLTDTQCIAITS
jgi:hypothetical protein